MRRRSAASARRHGAAGACTAADVRRRAVECTSAAACSASTRQHVLSRLARRRRRDARRPRCARRHRRAGTPDSGVDRGSGGRTRRRDVTGVTRRPAFWVAYAIAALLALALAARLFPLAIPLVNLDITMSRAEAIEAARSLATRLKLAPEGARVAARFAHDATTQNYVELEGGGKPAFARADAGRPLRAVLVGRAPVHARRHRRDGRPVQARRHADRVSRDACRRPTCAIPRARRSTRRRRAALAEARARDGLGHRPRAVSSCSSSRSRRRPAAASTTASSTSGPSRWARRGFACALGGGRRRARPASRRSCTFPNRSTAAIEELRSANNLIANLATVSAGLLYGIGGCILGVLWLAREHWLVWRPADRRGARRRRPARAVHRSPRRMRRGSARTRRETVDDVLVEAGGHRAC